MTTDEFFNQPAPYFFRNVVCRPPEDWPKKGHFITLPNGKKKRVTGHELRLEYVRRGLVAYYAEYMNSQQPQAVVGDQQSLFES